MAKATNPTPKAFHVPDAKYTVHENTLSHAVERSRITSEDAALIEEFTGRLQRPRISPSRKFKITCTLVGWRRFIGLPGEQDRRHSTAGVERMRSSRKDDPGPPVYTKTPSAIMSEFLKRFTGGS